VNLTKIAILFFVCLVSLTVYDFYLQDLYHNWTDGEGRDLAETFLGYILVLGASFILTFALMKKAEKAKAEDDSGGSEQ